MIESSITVTIDDYSLVVVKCIAREGICAIFDAELECFGDKIKNCLGSTAYISFDVDPEERSFCGIVSSIKHLGFLDKHSTKFYKYYIKITSSISQLDLGKDFNVFYNTTVKDIVYDFCSNYCDIDWKVSDDYAFDYKAQYDESCWHFLQRLTEEKCIGYFLNTSSDSITFFDQSMIFDLCYDDPIAIRDISIPAYIMHTITQLTQENNLVPLTNACIGFAINDPSTMLYSCYDGSNELSNVLFLPQVNTMESIEKITDYEHAHAELISNLFYGHSTCPYFGSGLSWTLSDNNKSYVINTITHHMESKGGVADILYHNEFTAFISHKRYIPALEAKYTPIYGVQTAQVTQQASDGSDALVLYTWDKSNEQYGVKARVAQTSASSALFSPRESQEVLISFINGNPDMPVIHGYLYNGNSSAPYAFDEQKTVLRSDTYDNDYTEIVFDDSSGDMQINVAGSCTINPVNNMTININIGGLAIQSADSITISCDQGISIDASSDINITAGGSITLESGTGITLISGETSISMDESVSINSSNEVNVSGTQFSFNTK